MTDDSKNGQARKPAVSIRDACEIAYAAGLAPVPTIAGTKRPTRRGYQALPYARGTLEETLRTFGARHGLAVVVGRGSVVIDVDRGGDDARRRIEATLGPPECVVLGQRGWKLFYAAKVPELPDDLAEASAGLLMSGARLTAAAFAGQDAGDAKAHHRERLLQFRRMKGLYVAENRLIESCSRTSPDGEVAIDVLSDGRIAVMPPTPHPATEKPYRYEEGLALTATTFFACNEVEAEAVDAMLDEVTGSRPARPAARQRGHHHAGAPAVDLERVRAALKHLSSDDRSLWIRVGMALKAGIGDAGLELWDDWSRGSPKHVDGECEDKWEGFSHSSEGGVGLGTIFYEATQAGWVTRTSAADDFRSEEIPTPYSTAPATVPEQRASTALTKSAPRPEFELGDKGRVRNTLVNTMLAMRLADLGLAYDELAQRPVFTAPTLPWKVDIGREVNDDALRVLRHWITECYEWEPSKENVVEAALTLATESRFNPVCDYLSEREKEWDGIERLDLLLPAYLGAPDGEYERRVGRMFMIAAVRRARRPGCKFDTMLILEGPQGSGKSSAVRRLGGQYHSDAPLSNLDGKDAIIGLQNAWIVEHPELTTLSRSEVGQLKAFLSRMEDRLRTPYGKALMTVPRRCVFIGTTNESGYLRDHTGNRRFLPVTTGRIDLGALARHRDQLWAEAAVAEAAGEPIELPRELWDEAAERQGQRMVEDPWIPKVREYVERQRKLRISTTELLDGALQIHCSRQTPLESRRLRQVMEALGWEYKKSIRIEGRVTTGYEAPDATQDLFYGGTTP